jgi:hypothetical protein
VTTTVPDTMLVHLLAKRQEAPPTPAGTTQRSTLMVYGGGVTTADERFAGPGPTTGTSGVGVAAEWIAQTVALRRVAGTPSAGLSWTPSSSSWATGYLLERLVGGSVQAGRNVTPVGTTSATDAAVVNGTSYTFRLSAYRGTWRSAAVTATLTPSC